MSITAKAPNSEKGKRYFAQLDQALCNGSWTEIPELARKTDKHAPERACFTLAARTEAQIASASHRPTSASSTGTSSIHSLGNAVPKLQEAVSSGKNALDDVYCARACLAEIFWLQEDTKSALEVIPRDSPPTGPGGGQTAPLGWQEVCAAKLSFIRAATLEARGQAEEVRRIYRDVAAQTPGSRTPELRRWTERLLARACMFNYHRAAQPTIESLSGALACFRAWSSFWQRAPPPASTSGSGRTDIPRRSVWKAYYDLQSVILRHDLLFNTPSTGNAETLLVSQRETSADSYTEAKVRQRAELSRVEKTYEALLLSETHFPKATESNTEVEQWVAQAVENWKVLSGADWTDEELGEGGKAALGRDVLDILYRASTKTFHSTAILRQLFTVHATLGEFELAVHAYNSYAEIVGKAKARAEKTGKHELGEDDDDTALSTACEAVRVLCKYGDREQAEKAVAVGNTIVDWLGRQRPENEDEMQTSEDTQTGHPEPADSPTIKLLKKSTLAAAYRAVGISQAHWARTTHDADGRAGLQKDAATSLRRASEYGESDVETAYALARVLAETQDVPAAIEILKKAIAASQSAEDEHDDSFARQRQLVPLWHLLALCLTARDEHEAAAKMCEVAFDQFGESEVLFGRQTAPSQLRDGSPQTRIDRGVVDIMDDFEKQTLLQVKLSQLTLLELMEGPERAADSSDEVLRLYARLFGTPNSLRSTTKPPPTAASMAPPPSRAAGGTLRSIAGSIRPKSARTSAETPSPRQVSNNLSVPTSSASPGRQAAPTNGTNAAPISITVTNEDGVSAEKGGKEHHHHLLHLPFKTRGHHGQDFRDAGGSLRSRNNSVEEDLNEKSDPVDGAMERPPPVPPKDTSVMDHAAQGTSDSSPVGAAVNHSTSTESPSRLLTEIVHNRPPTDWPPPTGHNDQPPSQDVRLPAPHPATSHGPPVVAGAGSIQERQHRISILLNIWLFVAGLYVRADFYEDAAGAVEEAVKLVEAFEAEKVAQRANAEKMFRKGWGGGESVDELWGDVWALKGDLAVARELPFQAMEAYEHALDYWPDHPDGIIGLAKLLMDIYEQRLPAEEPEPPLVPLPTISRSSLTTNPQPTKLPPLTTSKSSLASPAGRGLPPSARRSKDPTPAELNRLAARDRAYMLLSSLTRLGTGWDNSEAWFTLARAYELSRQVRQAKRALWWVVELEGSKAMRGWGTSSAGGYVI